MGFNGCTYLFLRGTLTPHVQRQHYSFAAEQRANRVAGLCTVFEPVKAPLGIQGEGSRLIQRIVATQVLDVPSVARRT